MSGVSPVIEYLDSDLAIIGSGGAGIMAALHASRAAPELNITLVSKGMVGRSGCTIMTHGFNAALHRDDSLNSHFRDMVHAGEYLNDQELAWQLVKGAPEMIYELESMAGCYFDRNPDGSIHQLPFAAQSFDRKVHRGDDLGLEIMSCITNQLAATQLRQLHDTRALDLILDDNGAVTGVALLDIQRGIPLVLKAPVVLIATGGAANMYRQTSAAREKTGDGMAMCYRAGASFRDMEMMQFLSVGLVSKSSGHTGLPLEERLRYEGAHLLNVHGERFMEKYHPKSKERATRDQVVRACYCEIMDSRGTPAGGVFLDVRHLKKEQLETQFGELLIRAQMLGQDPLIDVVEISPTAHFQVGGVLTGDQGETNIQGLLVAGEDTGGVHGASWTGGNGVAESTVFGARAGDFAASLCREALSGQPRHSQAKATFQQAFSPLSRTAGEKSFELTQTLREVMWRGAGPVRNAKGLSEALSELNELEERITKISVPGQPKANPAWQQTLDLPNLLTVAKTLVISALTREESRGVHFRSDFPHRNDREWLRYIVLQNSPGGPVTHSEPVQTSRLAPHESSV